MSNKKKILGLSLVLASTTILTSCDTSQIGDRIETTVNNMLPNIWVTLIQLGIFILTVVVFVLIAYKPLKKRLNKRADYIEKNIKDSEDKKKEASDTLNKANQIVMESQKKAGTIISDAQKTAELKANSIQKELSESIEKQKSQAHKDIEDERKKMLKEAQSEIVDAAISTSKEILGREVTSKDNDKLVDEFIKELQDGDESKK